jgi:hypothetical protein
MTARQRRSGVDRQARAQIAALGRQIKQLIVECGMRGWITPAQARVAIRILNLRRT